MTTRVILKNEEIPEETVREEDLGNGSVLRDGEGDIWVLIMGEGWKYVSWSGNYSSTVYEELSDQFAPYEVIRVRR